MGGDDRTLLTVSEAVARMRPVRVSASTVRRRADSGRLRTARIGSGRHRRIRAVDVDRWRSGLLAVSVVSADQP
jgi:excisionase family DNA binding protein